jgi:hypothetical protein
VRAAELKAAPGLAIVTGFVAPDAVPAHVALFDVGLVPFVRSPLTDAMLPIKVFDYGAARKPVVATPLDAYVGEELPFVRVAPAEPGAQARAILEALECGWDASWDGAVEAHEWTKVVGPLEDLLDPRRGTGEITVQGAPSSGG